MQYPVRDRLFLYKRHKHIRELRRKVGAVKNITAFKQQDYRDQNDGKTQKQKTKQVYLLKSAPRIGSLVHKTLGLLKSHLQWAAHSFSSGVPKTSSPNWSWNILLLSYKTPFEYFTPSLIPSLLLEENCQVLTNRKQMRITGWGTNWTGTGFWHLHFPSSPGVHLQYHRCHILWQQLESAKTENHDGWRQRQEETGVGFFLYEKNNVSLHLRHFRMDCLFRKAKYNSQDTCNPVELHFKHQAKIGKRCQ